MEKELFYFTLESETQATARIYGEIGSDVICGAFCDELAYVESLGVTEITVRIHSCGGSVVDGFGIFSALMKSKATITTHNDGLAASTAGWLFLAGTAAVMADYSLLMLHNPSSPNTSKKGMEVVDVMRQSILTILSKRTGCDVATLSDLMDEETWMNAEQALGLGFATSIEATELMIELEPAAQSAEAMYSVCNSVLNKNVMTKNDAENEAVTVEAPAVEEVTNEAVEVVEEPTTIITDELPAVVEETTPIDDEKEELSRVNAELTAKLAALEATVNAFQMEADKKAEAEKEAQATHIVNHAIEAGKIKAEAKAHWLNMATSNYDTTKAALESINVVNKSNPGVMAAVKNLAANSGEKVVTYRELDRNNPKELARIKAFEPATYNELFFNQFGVYPTA